MAAVYAALSDLAEGSTPHCPGSLEAPAGARHAAPARAPRRLQKPRRLLRLSDARHSRAAPWTTFALKDDAGLNRVSS